MKKALDSLKLKGTILVGFSKDELETKRACQNLPKVTCLDVMKLNVLDVLNNRYLVISEEGVKALENKYKTK